MSSMTVRSKAEFRVVVPAALSLSGWNGWVSFAGSKIIKASSKYDKIRMKKLFKKFRRKTSDDVSNIMQEK